MKKGFILASRSPQRIALLKQIGYYPEEIMPADIDETPKKCEKPSEYVKRMAKEKALAVYNKNKEKAVLASDTVIVAGTKIIQKSKNDEEQIKVMKLLSGKTHKVLTAVCVINQEGKISLRLNVTKIKMKRLTEEEIFEYVKSKEWVGCAGYKIEGKLAGFVKEIIGSYSGVVGLPLYEVKSLLEGIGIK